jgi:hypothetical protein
MSAGHAQLGGMPSPPRCDLPACPGGQSFNADFYVTCATVIPVLFLAVAVQGRAYESMLRSAQRRPQTGKFGRLSLPYTLAGSVLIAAAGGEYLALLVLYQGSDWTGAREVVFACTLILVTAVGAGPVVLWLKAKPESRPSVIDVPTQAAGGGPGQTRAGDKAEARTHADEPGSPGA